MGAVKALHERLLEIAVAANRRRIAINLARAVASLRSAGRPTSKEEAEVATADEAAVAQATRYRSGESGTPFKLWRRRRPRASPEHLDDNRGQ